MGRSPDGSIINLEIQVAKQEYMVRRSLYYWSRLYNSGLKSGEEYIELKRTVVINILDFNLFEKNFIRIIIVVLVFMTLRPAIT